MARRKRTSKRSHSQPSKPSRKKPLHKLRLPSGRFASRDDIEYLSEEEVQRVYDDLFRPGWAEARAEKVQQVKTEKIDRRRRFELDKTNYSTIPLERADADVKLIKRSGLLPKPTSIRQIGPYKEYIWAYRGMGGKRAVNQILIHDKFPPDTMGVTAFGTGYGKQATWAGTRTSTPLELLNDVAYETLFATGSGKLIRNALNDDPSAIWWEVKLVTTGDIGTYAQQETVSGTSDDAYSHDRVKAKSGKRNQSTPASSADTKSKKTSSAGKRKSRKTAKRSKRKNSRNRKKRR